MCPAAVIYCGADRVSVCRSSQYVHDQALIEPTHREIHGPSIVRAPVPVQHILPVFCKPVPFYIIPQALMWFCNSCSVLLCALKYCLAQSSPWIRYEVSTRSAAIVFPAEGNGYTCGAIHPMGKHAMIGVCFCKKLTIFSRNLAALSLANPFPFGGYNHRHHTKTGSTCSYYFIAIIISYITSFSRHSTDRMCKIQKVTECLPLYQVKQRAV